MKKAIRILYIDDSNFDRELVKDALAQEPGAFELTLAGSREEFEQRLAKEDFDLVLSDFNILGYEGLQVLEAVKGVNPDLPVVIVTGTGSEEIAVKALQSGAIDYVIKSPSHIRRLPATIRAALERKQLQLAEQRYHQRLEEEVVERSTELLRAQQILNDQRQLAALGRLAGSVSQELLNPLGVMSNAVYFLQRILPDADAKVRDYLDILQDEIRTTERIVTDLLNFARLKPLHLVPVKVSMLVNYCLYRFPPPNWIKIDVNLPDDLPELFIDMDQITHVLGNVVLNAYQALAGEDLETPTVENPTVTIIAARQDQMIRLAVKDNGPGIGPENLEHIFEPMFSTKTRALGLGLTVCKQVVEANNGWVEVHSQPGQGSEFVLVLPIVGVEVVQQAGEKKLVTRSFIPPHGATD